MAVPTTKPQTDAKPASRNLVDRFSVVLVAVAATMWASDTYFRAQLIGHLTASEIVFVEDGLITLFLLVFLIRGIPEMRRLQWRQWLAVGLIGLGPQAIATILFTTSFSYRHFAETFVLQQTQPLIAILLAWVILGERRRRWFWPVAMLAILGVYMVVFAQNLTAPFSDLQHGRLEAGLFALGAAALWASGTVLGRFVLGTLSFPTTTALRFTVALPILLLVLLVQSGPAGGCQQRFAHAWPFLRRPFIPGLPRAPLDLRALPGDPAAPATRAVRV